MQLLPRKKGLSKSISPVVIFIQNLTGFPPTLKKLRRTSLNQLGLSKVIFSVQPSNGALPTVFYQWELEHRS